MSEWICNDIESPEEWDARMKKYRSMTSEELEEYFKNKTEAEKSKAAV